MEILILLTGSAVIVGAIHTENYLAKKKSWIPGIVLPCIFILIFVLASQYGYPFLGLTADNITPSSSIQELNIYISNDLKRFLLRLLNILLINVTIFLFITERKKRKD